MPVAAETKFWTVDPHLRQIAQGRFAAIGLPIGVRRKLAAVLKARSGGTAPNQRIQR